MKLSVSAWAADGLLAIFFFVVGLELKREFVAGDLRDPARAALPIAAALGGMIVPADLYVAINLAAGHPDYSTGGPCRSPPTSPSRWRCSRCCPPTCRRRCARSCSRWPSSTTCSPSPSSPCSTPTTCPLGPLALALIPIGLFAAAAAARRAITGGCWSRWPWSPGRWCTPAECTRPSRACCWASPCQCSAGTADPLAEHFEHGMRPVSAGFAVPVFAFFAAGVTVGGWSGLGASLPHPMTDGVIAGLVVGKPLGVFATALPTGQVHPCQPR